MTVWGVIVLAGGSFRGRSLAFLAAFNAEGAEFAEFAEKRILVRGM